MIARAFLDASLEAGGVVIFASGVSRSTATEPAEFRRESVLLGEVMAHASTGRRLLVYFSTASAHLYGHGDGSPRTEEDPVAPTTAYGRHKVRMEEAIRVSGVDHLILRVTEVVGPRQRPHQLLPALAAQVAAGEVTVYRGVRRDLVDVVDLVAVTGELVSGGLRRATVNIASGHPVTAEDIVSRLVTLSGRTVTKIYVDTPPDTCNVSIRKMAHNVRPATLKRFSPTYCREVIDCYYSP